MRRDARLPVRGVGEYQKRFRGRARRGHGRTRAPGVCSVRTLRRQFLDRQRLLGFRPQPAQTVTRPRRFGDVFCGNCEQKKYQPTNGMISNDDYRLTLF